MRNAKVRLGLLVGAGVVGALFAEPALSASSSVLAGRASPSSDESCFAFSGLNLRNTCGSGTTNTKKYLVPVSAAATGSFTAKVRGEGALSTSGPHVSCVAKAYQGDGVFISARGTTTGAASAFQTFTLGNVNVSSNTGLIFDCDSTFGGKLTAVFW
ncbi:MAG: hypothetical protein ACOY0T_09355 [Myxococcota bacterium]